MPEFVVHLIDPQRGALWRSVSAADAQAAVSVLRIDPRRVLSVKAAEPSSAASPTPSRNRAFPLRLFSQELAVLLAAGIPLLEGLVTLREKEIAASQGNVALPLSGIPSGGGRRMSSAWGRSVVHALDAVIEQVQSGQQIGRASCRERVCSTV